MHASFVVATLHFCSASSISLFMRLPLCMLSLCGLCTKMFCGGTRKLCPQQGALWPSASWTLVIFLVLQNRVMIQVCFGILIRQICHSHTMVTCRLWAITLSKKKKISKCILQLQRYFLKTSNYFSQSSVDLLCWWRENQQISQLCFLYLFSLVATHNEISRILILTEQKFDLKKSLVVQLLFEKTFEVVRVFFFFLVFTLDLSVWETRVSSSPWMKDIPREDKRCNFTYFHKWMDLGLWAMDLIAELHILR